MNRLSLRQLVVGLVALPFSVIPFLAYATFTPEGRLVRDKVRVALAPPKLPSLSADRQREAAGIVPTYAGRVMALVYHGIGSTGDAEGGYVVSPARFGEHLAALRAAGMHVVTAADIAWARAVDVPLPERAVMISFDDGRTDAMLFADPLLKQAGMKATMFVISEAAAKPGLYYAGWGRLRDAAASGRWDIQAHSHAAHRLHAVDGGDELPALTSLAPGETLDEYRARIRDDLETNAAAIQAHVGPRPVAFAYPFGAHGTERTNDPRIEAILREEVARRFVIAFHQDDQETVPLVGSEEPRVGLRRLSVEDWSGVELLHQVARAVSVTGTTPAPATPDAGTTPLPPIPFLDELRRDAPSSDLSLTAPAPATVTAAMPAPTTTTVTSGLPDPLAAPPTNGATTATTSGPTSTTIRPPTTSTTTRPPTTTTTRPPTTTTTTRPPATTTTTSPPPPTTTTTRCHDNRKSCRK